MRFHHQPERAETSRRLVELVAAADHMANYVQRGEAIEAYNPPDNAALTSLWARWPEARRDRFLGELPAMMQESLRAAGSASEQTA